MKNNNRGLITILSIIAGLVAVGAIGALVYINISHHNIVKVCQSAYDDLAAVSKNNHEQLMADLKYSKLSPGDIYPHDIEIIKNMFEAHNSLKRVNQVQYTKLGCNEKLSDQELTDYTTKLNNAKAKLVAAHKHLMNQIEKVESAKTKLANRRNELDDIEHKIAAIENQKGEDGTYKQSAKAIVEAAGLKQVTSPEGVSKECKLNYLQSKTWVAWFCSANPDRIFVNTEAAARIYDSEYFADSMRHELAHFMIYERCGKVNPKSILENANAENTANAYSLLYLGGKKEISDQASDYRYKINDPAIQSAKLIHDNQCN